MKKNRNTLTTQISFPIGAESDLFTAALSSVLIHALGYTEDTPYWCPPRESYCIHCSPCGDKPLNKHQETIYHCLLTATGLAFGFEYPWDDSVEPHSLPGYRNGWRWDNDYIDFVMRFAGVTWKSFDKSTDKRDILKTVTLAIDNGFPALARLQGEFDWQIVTGYDGDTLLGLEAHEKTFETNTWYDTLLDMIVITGRCERGVTYNDVLRKIIDALAYPGHDALETSIFNALDSVTEENAMEIAGMLTGINGFCIEARWHAGEAFCPAENNLLYSLCDNKDKAKKLGELFFTKYIKDNNDETQGIGWKIWGCLGVGPKTRYMPTEESAKLIQKPEVREELKRLFGIIFKNDREILEGIRNLYPYLQSTCC